LKIKIFTLNCGLNFFIAPLKWGARERLGMKVLYHFTVVFCSFVILAACSTTPTNDSDTPDVTDKNLAESPKAEKATTPNYTGPYGNINVDITNIRGQSLPARIELISYADGTITGIDCPKGETESKAPVGEHRAYVYALEQDIPVLVDIQEISIKEDGEAFLLLNLMEGASDVLPLRSFDYDGDLAIDRVERSAGTNPEDPSSVPGKRLLPYENQRGNCRRLQITATAPNLSPN